MLVRAKSATKGMNKINVQQAVGIGAILAFVAVVLLSSGHGSSDDRPQLSPDAPSQNVVAGQGRPQSGEATTPSPKLSDTEAKALIAKVKSDWRAQDGETAEAIISAVSRVAHFVPRVWEAGQTSSGDKWVALSWAKHDSDDAGSEYTISWTIAANGAVALALPYAKPMELGWRPFAISQIANEIEDEEKNPNTGFLHDLANLNFVETPQGPLGSLLAEARCNLGDPVGLDYVSAATDENGHSGDFWRLQLSVNCDASGSSYFTQDGVVLFKKEGTGPWSPASVLAKRISTSPPGSWFKAGNTDDH